MYISKHIFGSCKWTEYCDLFVERRGDHEYVKRLTFLSSGPPEPAMVMSTSTKLSGGCNGLANGTGLQRERLARRDNGKSECSLNHRV